MAATQGERAAAAALTYVGTPYKFGGCTHQGIDCSCLCRQAWSVAGKTIPRTTFLQWPGMRPVLARNRQPGDMIFYLGNDGGPGPGHVVMYTGGGQMVEAAHTGTRVRTGPVYGGSVGTRRPWGVARTPTAGAVTAGSSSASSATSSRQTKCTGLNALNPFCQLGLEFETVGRWLEVGAGALGLIVGAAIMIVGATGATSKAGKAAGVAASFVPGGTVVKTGAALVGERQAAQSRNARDEAKARTVTEGGKVRTLSRKGGQRQQQLEDDLAAQRQGEKDEIAMKRAAKEDGRSIKGIG